MHRDDLPMEDAENTSYISISVLINISMFIFESSFWQISESRLIFVNCHEILRHLLQNTQINRTCGFNIYDVSNKAVDNLKEET